MSRVRPNKQVLHVLPDDVDHLGQNVGFVTVEILELLQRVRLMQVLVVDIGDHGADPVHHFAHVEVLLDERLFMSGLDERELESQGFVLLLESNAEAEDFHISQLAFEEATQVLHHQLVRTDAVLHLIVYLVDAAEKLVDSPLNCQVKVAVEEKFAEELHRFVSPLVLCLFVRMDSASVLAEDLLEGLKD